jgi:hypothetical protein
MKPIKRIAAATGAAIAAAPLIVAAAASVPGTAEAAECLTPVSAASGLSRAAEPGTITAVTNKGVLTIRRILRVRGSQSTICN